MKKKYKVDGLDCANCASKVEEKIKKLDGVNDVKMSYIMGNLKLEIEDNIDEKQMLNKIEETGKKIEPSFKIS